jgi:transposase
MSKNKKQRRSSNVFDPNTLEALDKKTLVSMLVKIHEQYQELSETMQAFMREKYGPKTERFADPDQLRIFSEEDTSQSQSVVEHNAGKASVNNNDTPAKTSERKNRNPRQSNVPHVPIRGEYPSAEVLCCPGCMIARPLANEVLRGSRYVYKPASVIINDYIASVFACSECGDALVVEPDIHPSALKLEADAALVSAIAVERFEDALPLHRQERRFARLGVPIARSTMCGWLAQTSLLLRPIYDRMKQLLLQSKVIATDDTPIKVQDRSKAKNIKIGRVWIYRGDDSNPVNLFDYTSGRARAGPIAFLAGFDGFLLGDCFSGNQALCAETGCTHVACHAHARRYWIKAELNYKKASAAILKMYSQLFDIERDAKELGVKGKDLKLMREQEAKPILEAMKIWLDQNALIALPKSTFGKAIQYCLNNWTELNNYLLDGDLRIDNNLAEQEMKRVAVFRKNALFFGSDKGGENAEVFMSLISTCRRHNVEPWTYLTDVIEKLTIDPDQDLDSLLPHLWASPLLNAEITGISAPQKMPAAAAK